MREHALFSFAGRGALSKESRSPERTGALLRMKQNFFKKNKAFRHQVSGPDVSMGGPGPNLELPGHIPFFAKIFYVHHVLHVGRTAGEECYVEQPCMLHPISELSLGLGAEVESGSS